MKWPEDISNDLPAPQPDEPPMLRSDILDELHDHLQSSLEHEQIKGNDAEAARTSVLSKFGNPSTIACQLWWDTMWEKVMIQRITLGFVAILSVCAIAATFLIWQAVQQSQQVTVALVEQVERLADRVANAPVPDNDKMQYMDWIPVTVKLEYEDGEPVTDQTFEATLEGSSLLGPSENSVTLERHSSSEGEIDFGFVKPGEISLTVNTPWSESHSQNVVVVSGSPLELTVTCPRESSIVPVSLSVDWPDDIEQHDLWTYLWLEHSKEPRMVGTTDWRTSTLKSKHFMISPSGEVVETVSAFSLLDKQDPAKEDALQRLSVMVPDDFESYLLEDTRVDDLKLNRFLPILDRSLFHVDLGEPLDIQESPTQGLKIKLMWVMKKAQLKELVEQTSGFRGILPVAFFRAGIKSKWGKEAFIQADDWTYRPSEDVANLVRKRLQQIDELDAEKQAKADQLIDESP